MGKTSQSEKQGITPGLQIYDQILGDIRLRLIHAVTELDIADHIGAGIHGVDELAEKSGVNADLLHRVMRALSGYGIFAETEDRNYEITPQAEFLRGDARGSLKAFILYLGSEWHYRTWDRFLETLRSGETSYDLAFGTPFFDHLREHPDRAENYKKLQTGHSVMNAAHIAGAYDFSQFGTVMDVGGGQGSLLAEILKSAPSARGILFDMPGVASDGKDLFETAGVGDRASIAEGSFFDALPGGADAIVMKSIIHDWNDERARRILRNCREALGPGGKVLVCESLLPGKNEPSVMKLIDMEMLAISGGQERTEAEFRALFESAGLELKAVYATRTGMSILESEVSV